MSGSDGMNQWKHRKARQCNAICRYAKKRERRCIGLCFTAALKFHGGWPVIGETIAGENTTVAEILSPKNFLKNPHQLPHTLNVS